jgi:hypothetical protein
MRIMSMPSLAVAVKYTLLVFIQVSAMQTHCVAAAGLPDSITNRMRVVIDCLSTKRTCPPLEGIASHGKNAIVRVQACLAEHGQASWESAQRLVESVLPTNKHKGKADESQVKQATSGSNAKL